MEALFFQVFVVLFGLVIGSFLTVCIYRIPLGRPKGPPLLRGSDEEFEDTGEEDIVDEEYDASEVEEELPEISVSYPKRSFCPSCNTQLKWYNNIPFFSWLFQGGKCAYCKERISAMYPVVELMSGFTALLCFQQYVMSPPFSFPTALLIYIFCCSLIVITFIDMEYYIIPNKITYPGVILGVLIGIQNQFTSFFALPVTQSFMDSFWGFMAGAGFLWFVGKTFEIVRGHQGLGLGDVKLLAVVGVLFGSQCALFTIFMGSLVGAVLGGLSLLLLRHRMSRPLPFGPYLAIATYIFLFVGPGSVGLLFPGFRP